MSNQLNDQVAVITGATGAIGRATSEALARQGARVAALGRDPGRLATVAGIEGVSSWPVDCTDASALERVADEVRTRLGPPDILVTLAGGNGFPVPSAQETPEHWREVIDSDLTSTFLTIRTFLGDLARRPGGRIVTMSSAAARRPGGSSAAYAAAKAGVITLTQHLARELLREGVRVSCVAPGAVLNDRMRAMPTDRLRAMEERLPIGRVGTPEEVAEAVLHLVTDASSSTTGAVLDLGGAAL